MKIAALTVCCVDFYPQQKKSFLGGNSLNYAAQAISEGSDNTISVIAAVGNDEYGERIIKYLERNNISTSFVYKLIGNTANNQIINDEYGERFGVPNAWKNGVYGSFLLSDSDWLFTLNHDIVAMPANNPNFEMLIKRKTKQNFIVSDFLDVENNIPLEKYISETDIAQIAGREHLLDNYQELANRTGKLLVVTLGALGSVVFYNGKQYRQEAVQVPNVIDTTGCGDSYLAGFSIEYFKTRNVSASMKAGAKAASLVLQHYGGVIE